MEIKEIEDNDNTVIKNENINTNKDSKINVKEVSINNNVEENIDKKNTNYGLKRDYTIDLIRIIACILVIGTHCCLQAFNEYYSQVDWSRLFEKCFLTDGVPLFFMITGFFLISRKDYKRVWKTTAIRILLPTFIYVVFVQIFYMFIVNKESFVWCLKNARFNMNILGIIRTILTGDLAHINSLCEHLWYIFSYVKIIIWFPILWLICREEKTAIIARRIIIGFGIVSTIIIDVQRFYTFPLIGIIKTYELVGREILFVIFGYELFVHKDKIKNNKKLFIISSLIFIVTNIIRYRVEMHYMVINSFYDIVGRDSFMEWRYTFLNILSGIALFIALYSFEIKSEKIGKILVWISNKTFGIYLIHYILLAKVDLYKFDKLGRLSQELVYLLLSISITFVVSLAIVSVIKLIEKYTVKITKNIL